MEDVTVVKLDTQEAQTSVKALRAELKNLKDQMAGLEEGSDEFLKLAQSAGTLKHQIDEINQSVKGASADFGDMLSNATQTANGIIGGFQAAKGALTLFGVESEEVTKSIQKMQASMAIIQGISSIDEGIKALAKLRGAITATTGAAKLLRAALTPKSILLLISAITAIVSIWNKWGDKIKELYPWLDKVSKAFEKVKDAIFGVKQAIEENTTSSEKLQNEYDKMLKEDKVSKLNKKSADSYKALEKQIELYQKQIDIIEAKKKENADDRFLWKELNSEGVAITENIALLKKQQEAILSNTESYKEETKAVKEETKAEDKLKQVKDTFFDDAYAEIEYNKSINEEYANSKTALEDLLNIQEQELATLEEGTAAWYNQATAVEKTKNEIENFGKVDEQTEQSAQTEEEKDPLILSLYDTKDALADLASDNSWGIILNNMGGLAVKMADVGKQIKQNGKQDWTAYAQIAAYALSSVGTILSQLASQEDATDKEGFERKKKLEISGAVMNMLGGIVGAVSSAMNPANAWMTIAGQAAMASIMSAMVAGVGAAQIASIQRQQFGSTSGVSTQVPSSSAISTTIIPPVEYSNAIQCASTEEILSNAKYYVSVTEFDRVQKRVNVAETESRY